MNERTFIVLNSPVMHLGYFKIHLEPVYMFKNWNMFEKNNKIGINHVSSPYKSSVCLNCTPVWNYVMNRRELEGVRNPVCLFSGP